MRMHSIKIEKYGENQIWVLLCPGLMRRLEEPARIGYGLRAGFPISYGAQQSAPASNRCEGKPWSLTLGS